MSSLFPGPGKQVPLAHKIRPDTWERFLGQKKVVGQIRSLTKPTSILFYGPPGTGKTTLAHLIVDKWNLPKRFLSAVTSGVKELREVIEESKKIGTIALFLDEIHRFSSSQQDALLPSVEQGDLILLAATTENPSFRINRALLSRMQVFRLQSLDEEDEKGIIGSALEIEGEGRTFTEESMKEILNASGGDARKLLGILEGLISQTKPKEEIGLAQVENFLGARVIQYDKNKESHYDVISAFIKSLRGSDPDAALYYLAIMLEGGEDPLFIARRLVVFASEDVGNASVHGLPLAIATWQAVERIGMPEARIPLGQCVSFLASAPKSNASYLGVDAALSFVRSNKSTFTIPNHLRNAPTLTHKKEGAGQGYKYPHDFPYHFIKEKYFPEEFYPSPPKFYSPTNQGMEKNLKEQLNKLWGDEK
ncbi:replication-associated recombination protein A [Leptospira ilyithenensis]|uniref:Replication-associated recombination protein A n=1 Tax=Leptospira ilyithenensis TaxID=2484901 RepID=A0A4R9LSK0_9LEPT|nr:replication-associated recombination protein A [Leptospira ilyithenensis]TGN11862.1 replication-associated recombination protein A [Leptospira ilyithenensis]